MATTCHTKYCVREATHGRLCRECYEAMAYRREQRPAADRVDAWREEQYYEWLSRRPMNDGDDY